MSSREHVGPSSRIEPGSEQQATNSPSEAISIPQRQVSGRWSKQKSKFGGIRAASRNVKKRSPKQNVPKAVAQAAQYARNPAHDFHKRRQEIASKRASAKKVAAQFTAQSTRWPAKTLAPPRTTAHVETHMIQYNKKVVPGLANQQVQRQQEQTIYQLKRKIYALQNQIHHSQVEAATVKVNPSEQPLAIGDIPLPQNSPRKVKAQSTPKSATNEAQQIRSTEVNSRTVESRPSETKAAKSPKSASQSSASESDESEHKSQPARSKSDSSKVRCSPELKLTTIDYDTILKEVKSRRTSSSSSSSSSNSSSSRTSSCDRDVLSLSDTVELPVESIKSVHGPTAAKKPRRDSLNWAKTLSDSSPERSTPVVTESQIAIRTATRPLDVTNSSSVQIDEWADYQTRLIQAYALQARKSVQGTTPGLHHQPQDPALYSPSLAQYPSQYSQFPAQLVHTPIPPPPPPVTTPSITVAPIINVRVDNAGHRHRRIRDLTHEEQARYQAEAVDKKKGAKKRLKKRIIRDRKQ